MCDSSVTASTGKWAEYMLVNASMLSFRATEPAMTISTLALDMPERICGLEGRLGRISVVDRC